MNEGEAPPEGPAPGGTGPRRRLTQAEAKERTRQQLVAAAARVFAQKGFAGVGYKKVYADYQRIVEEVMRTEKLPSSYKYYVKRYFANIHPNMAAPPQDPKQ